ncbi:MAG: DUF1080 domain-containing protein [Lewinella sp.]|nr:DUF1080 domain-containing protein [Lewinella sp.]
MFKILLFTLIFAFPFIKASAQEWDTLSLNDWTAFASPLSSWSLVGAVSTHPFTHQFSSTKGLGVLLNQAAKLSDGGDLQTQWEHGDLDLEFDFMLSTGSNSGIYLQGNYEIQLQDSWGKLQPTATDLGGYIPP